MNQKEKGRISNPNRDDLYKQVVYPVVNVYFSPRVFQQKMNHQSIKMCGYGRKIEATNLKRIYDQSCPDKEDLRELTIKDGMIFQLKDMPKFNVGLGKKKLKLKVLICVCMYNESKHAINLTLNGIYNNLQNLEDQGISSEEVAVVLLQDGILKLVADRNKRTYAHGGKSMVEFYRKLDRLNQKNKCDLDERVNTILDQIDNFNRKGMGSYIANNRDFPTSIEKNISLLYQNLWQPWMTDEFNVELDKEHEVLTKEKYKNKPFLKLFTCFKHLNGTKLSSHLWFFEGFCRYLQPQFVVLLDVGTKPEPEGILNLIRGFSDEDVGGVTGLMSVDSNFPSLEGEDAQDEGSGLGSCIQSTFFSIEKAQEYEYIISHFIDKNAEGALGFLHVLPGAWSAYRYHALIKSEKYEPNLLEHSYFKMVLNPDMEEKGYQEANMYLAQDRILSLGIYCQVGEKYYLKYQPDAEAKTDPMKDHDNLMKQRRRWINSSMFAFLYVWKNYYFHATESEHGGWDKYFKLNLAMLLALLSFLTSYITPSIYFYILYAAVYQIDPNQFWVRIAALAVSIVYVLIFLAGVAGALTGSQWTKNAYVISASLSIFTMGLFGLVTYNVIIIYLNLAGSGVDFTSFNQMSILVMSGINLGSFFLIIFMHVFTHPRYVWRLMCDQVSYLAYQAAYSQTMVAHAFCNVDDVSWGTKGSTGSAGEKKYATEKVFFVSAWLFWNAVLSYIFIYIDIVVPQDKGPNANRGIVLIVIAIYATIIISIKTILAVYHHIKWALKCNCCYPPIGDDIDSVRRFWDDSMDKYAIAVNQKKMR